MSGYTFGEKVDLGYHGEGRQVVAEDGTVLGVVYKSMRTWERRIPGRRYVEARGQTPCWRIEGDNTGRYGLTYDTRKQAAEELVWAREHIRPH